MLLNNLLNRIEVLDTNIQEPLEIKNVCYNSQMVQAGDLFVCLVGQKNDGHEFIESALKQGALAVVISNKNFIQEHIPYIMVRDTRVALSFIADNFYGSPSAAFKLIGVTGTNGKTSVTYMLKHILEEMGARVGLIGTVGAMIGEQEIGELSSASTTPEPMELQAIFNEMKREKAEYVIMEVSSHSLEQERVASCHYEVGIFTNLTQDHLDYHLTMENYIKAKAKLFSLCEVGVLNSDDDAYESLRRMSNAVNFSYSTKNNTADVIAKNIQYKPFGVSFEVLAHNELARANIDIPGSFTVYNSLAAISCALILGYPLQKVLEAVKTCKGVKGRMEVLHFDTPYTVIIDYAHTPDGMEKVLSAVKETMTKGSIIALFGCGGNRDKTKRPIMGRIAQKYADICIITSDNSRTESIEDIVKDILVGIKQDEKVKVIFDRKDAIEYALDIAQPDDIVMFLGKGHETYQILNQGTIHFDEREVVYEHLKKGDN